MGEDFLISPPWDTHTLVCNTYCQSERENKRRRQREGFFFCFFFCWSIETWATRGVKWWTLNAPSLEKLAHTATISLCVSAPERQCEECKWAYTKPLDCLLKGRWGKGERVNGWYKLQKRTFERCWNVSFHMWRPRVHQSEFTWHDTSPASLSLSPSPSCRLLPATAPQKSFRRTKGV